jgi:hypothetical protein
VPKSHLRTSPLLVSLLVVLLGSFSSVARAQLLEGYGTVSIDPLHVRTSYSETQIIDYTPIGFTFGGTFNFIPTHLIDVGLDVRDTAAKGANIWLAGFRVAVKPPVIKIKPYFKLAVGEARLKVPQTTNSSEPNPVSTDYYLYNAALGVDYKLNHFLDVRLIEIGDGRTLGGGSTNPTSFLTINFGIVLHTP